MHVVQWQADQRKEPHAREWLHFEVAEDGVDTLIMLGTNSMIEKAVRHGHQGPLYMDATHGMNDKGMKVVTLHVKDLEGRGASTPATFNPTTSIVQCAPLSHCILCRSGSVMVGAEI